MEIVKRILTRLKKPSVLLSLVSQIVSVLIMFGLDIDNTYIMTIASGISAILVTLGILSNPDTRKAGYGDDMLLCSTSGNIEPHVMVNGQMICKNCGAVYDPTASLEDETDDFKEEGSETEE